MKPFLAEPLSSTSFVMTRFKHMCFNYQTSKINQNRNETHPTGPVTVYHGSGVSTMSLCYRVDKSPKNRMKILRFSGVQVCS